MKTLKDFLQIDELTKQYGKTYYMHPTLGKVTMEKGEAREAAIKRFQAKADEAKAKKQAAKKLKPTDIVPLAAFFSLTGTPELDPGDLVGQYSRQYKTREDVVISALNTYAKQQGYKDYWAAWQDSRDYFEDQENS